MENLLLLNLLIHEIDLCEQRKKDFLDRGGSL